MCCGEPVNADTCLSAYRGRFFFARPRPPPILARGGDRADADAADLAEVGDVRGEVHSRVRGEVREAHADPAARLVDRAAVAPIGFHSPFRAVGALCDARVKFLRSAPSAANHVIVNC